LVTAYGLGMSRFETLLYDVGDGLATVTLNRPEVHNAFNLQMQHELKQLWRSLRSDDDVRCIVLTGAGERAFCAGIDREETMGAWQSPDDVGRQRTTDSAGYAGTTPWHFDDPGDNIGPKTNDLWKPVIAAVNGMACAGAFYLLGEVDVVIAAEHATFFDPHVTFGMTAGFESIHLLQKMPFHEIMRIALAGSNERMSAQRAFDIGFVTEVTTGDELLAAAKRLGRNIADAPPTAIQGTVRALWAARELSRAQALDMAKVIVRLGSDPASLFAGQERFATGQRIEWRLR
jgi:enoyl-CoA hydratase/carnithine racemase